MKYKILFLLFIAFAVAFSQTVSVSVSPTGWFADSISLDETNEMVCSDSIRITNIGSVPIDLSLCVSLVVDSGGAPLSWTPTYFVGDDNFVLRAEFTDSSIPPTSYSSSNDYLRSIWTNATETIFGPGGYNIPSGETQYLWFQFIAPTFSSYFGEFTITLNLKASPHSALGKFSMIDTTIDIDIHSTLRYPICLPPSIYIFDIECDSGSEYVYIKSDLGPGDRSDCDWYLVYRAPWALFKWSDVNIFGLSDTARMIDPIEDPMSHFDAGMYRWGWKEELAPGEDSVWVGTNYTYDFFGDTLLSATDSRGVCDPDTNWFYTVIAVDSNESDGSLSYSHSSARPVGEYDQWIVNGTMGTMNIVSYAVEVFDIEDSLGSASSFGRIIPNCICIAEWDAVSQDTIVLAEKVGGAWANYGTVQIGRAYVVYIAPSAPDSSVFSMYSPGYIPYDSDICPEIPFCFLEAPSSDSGFDIFAVPYQEYNILINGYGSFPLPARILGEDISVYRPDLNTCEIRRWNSETQTGDVIAYDSSGIWGDDGDAYVYPGEPLMVYISCDTSAVFEKSIKPNSLFIDAYPNPFNSSVVITLSGVNSSLVDGTVEIYDLRGTLRLRSVPDDIETRSLSGGCRAESRQAEMTDTRTFIWHPDKSISSGIYFVIARTENGQQITKRIVYLK